MKSRNRTSTGHDWPSPAVMKETGRGVLESGRWRQFSSSFDLFSEWTCSELVNGPGARSDFLLAEKTPSPAPSRRNKTIRHANVTVYGLPLPGRRNFVGHEPVNLARI